MHVPAACQVVPEKWAAARQACMDLHPGYEFRLWTDRDADRAVAENFPALLPTFRSYRFNIQRADVIRCARLRALPCPATLHGVYVYRSSMSSHIY